MTERAQTLEDDSRSNRYSSFLLRCWHVGEGELRIKIEHIQSGESTQVDSCEAALAWMSERYSEPGDGRRWHPGAR